jgi:hypothetical protein
MPISDNRFLANRPVSTGQNSHFNLGLKVSIRSVAEICDSVLDGDVAGIFLMRRDDWLRS